MSEPESAPSSILSRRGVIGSASAAAVAPTWVNLSATDQAAEPCQLWLAKEAEIGCLIRRWQKLETYLFKHHQWTKLSEQQQRDLPEAAGLHELDAQMDTLRREQGGFLAQLPKLVAGTREAVLLKFEVLANVLYPDDEPDTHAILLSAIRDLAAIWR